MKRQSFRQRILKLWYIVFGRCRCAWNHRFFRHVAYYGKTLRPATIYYDEEMAIYQCIYCMKFVRKSANIYHIKEDRFA